MNVPKIHIIIVQWSVVCQIGAKYQQALTRKHIAILIEVMIILNKFRVLFDARLAANKRQPIGVDKKVVENL